MGFTSIDHRERGRRETGARVLFVLKAHPPLHSREYVYERELDLWLIGYPQVYPQAVDSSVDSFVIKLLSKNA